MTHPAETLDSALFHETQQGQIYLGDSLDTLSNTVEDHSADLIMTSPPFGLVRKKSYGNVDAEEYVEWFKPFAKEFKRVLKEQGSLVIDIGGAWVPGQPTRSLYHFKLLIMHLAQEFYWWNPSKLPTPAEWVTVRRIRVKDAINCVWWLSPSPWPRASNRRVLQPYSDSMETLLKNGYKAQKRPSGHDISKKFANNNGAAIPPNLIALANTESNSFYLRYCKEHNLTPHPARFPAELPEYFIRMLTDAGDFVIDPFAGSCVTGEVCERLGRQWMCAEIMAEPLQGALGRFISNTEKDTATSQRANNSSADEYYKIARPGMLWDAMKDEPLPTDGGKERPKTKDAYLADVLFKGELAENSTSNLGSLPHVAQYALENNTNGKASTHLEQHKIEQIAFEL